MIDDTALRTLLGPHLPEDDALEQAFSAPGTNLFDLGLDSIATFALLDDLAAAGISVDFTEIVAEPTVDFLRRASER